MLLVDKPEAGARRRLCGRAVGASGADDGSHPQPPRLRRRATEAPHRPRTDSL